MSLKVEDYGGGYKIVSIACDDETRADLLTNEDLEFIYVSEGKAVLLPESREIKINNIEEAQNMNNYDVCEIWPDGRIYRYYDACSIDNYFFVTGKCNSNCIMCPSADYSRKNGNTANIGDLIEIAKHIPSDAAHLTITGGEPFVAGEAIFDFIDFLKCKFEETEILILTNGRAFAIDSFYNKLIDTIPNNCIIGVPIHGSTTELHDYITQAKGSFNQTCTGLKRLIKHGIRIEIRIVVSAINLTDITNIANLIVSEMPGVSYISIMAMEMTGSAYVNKERLWINYRDAFTATIDAIKILLNAGIDVKLYNFPLCAVKKEYWTLCEKSISPDKVKFSSSCDLCSMKSACGGVFSGTYMLENKELKPII